MNATTRIFGGWLLTLGSLAAFVATANGAITVYDLRIDFSNANNPNSTWQYFKGNTLLSHFTPVSNPTLAIAAANGYWGDTASSNNSALLLTTANGSATGSWSDNDFLVGEVLVRTTDPVGAPMIVTWTAPSNGTLTYSGEFWNANGPLGPSANSYTLSLNNGPALESGTAGPGQNKPLGQAMVNGLTPLNVLAGDVMALEFVAQQVGPPGGSLSGITFTIDFQPVPEPSTLALGTLALVGLLGFARRWQRARV